MSAILRFFDKSAADRAAVQATKASAPAHNAVTAVKTSAYNAVLNELVRVDPSGGAFAVVLPAITAQSAGQEIIIKNVTGSATAVNVTKTGADTIDGAAGPVAVSGAQFFRIYKSDGVSNWMLVSS